MMKYSIQEIAQILKINSSNLQDTEINVLLTDSRILRSPQDSLFFALVTPNNDGHKYISELYDLGVRNFVVSSMYPEWEEYKDANFLCVNDTLDALQKIASKYRKKFDIPIVAITGSNGKTVVKEWLYQVLHNHFKVTRSPRSFNSQIGVPLSIWEMNENTGLGIFEAGISDYEEMNRLELVIQPTIGIFTNIGQAHQESFKSMKEKCLEKLDLFINADIIICEEENELLDECMQIACLSQKRFTWSRKGNDSSPVQVLDIKTNTNTTEIKFTVLGLKNSIEIPYVDWASIENALHVLTAAIYLRAPIQSIKEYFCKLEPVSMRMDVSEGMNNCCIINDSYNSDINSLSIALDFLNQRATNMSLKKSVILSDILQTGLPLKELYTITAHLLEEKGVEQLVGIGSDISKFKELFSFCESNFYSSTEEFINKEKYKDFRSACILVKGARIFGFENLIKKMQEQKHTTIMEINLDAIVHNYNYYKSSLDPKTKIICMIKADGYGAGSSEIAKTLQYHKADYFAVAVAEEGISLRKSGIKKPIIVLNAEVGGFEELYNYSLEPEIYNFRLLHSFIDEANKVGVSDYPIHLKLDTGMHRLGFEEKDLNQIVEVFNNQTQLKISSVFSHLAASEDPKFDEFTKKQLNLFKDLTSQLSNKIAYHFQKHILNSAGIERFSEYQFDMVRLGISLYGVSASGQNGLKGVHTLKTTILQIKNLSAGETVGYGCKGQITKSSKIATIRIGYADGLDRRFGNGVGSVWVGNCEVPFIGNICMDLSMIDITNVKDVREGDTVIIFGGQVSIQQMADKIGVIPYEILTSISPRVKHLYYRE